MPKRTDLTVPEYAQGYLDKAGADDLLQALKKSTKRLKQALKSIPHKKWDYAYAEGKWPIRQLVQHMIDTERVFLFRAVWFSRNDPNPLPGFDENSWAAHATAKTRKPESLVDEMLTLRKSTEQFFKSLDEEALLRSGISNKNPIGVAAIGFITAGHTNHHIDILEERYFKKREVKGKKKKGNTVDSRR